MQTRVNQIRESFEEWGVDGLLVTTPANRRWLTGFTGSAGRLLITASNAVLSTDSRYWTQVEQQAPQLELYRHRDLPDDTKTFLESGGAKRIGIEANAMPLADFRALEKLEGFEWIPLSSPVERFRQVKSAEELALIQAAARITDSAVEQFPSFVRSGVTERELAWLLEKTMRELGADRIAFDIIVASGPNTALPHHRPGDREVRSGDALIVDLGAEVDGYKSDLTRSFYFGDTAPDTYWAIYNTVLAAETAAIEQLQGGMTGKAADALARTVIVDAGYGDYFGHGLGHGVGLEIHEEPRLARIREKEIVPTGAVVTIEPGIYIPDFAGVRIEDLALVGDERVTLMSHAPKTPLIN